MKPYSLRIRTAVALLVSVCLLAASTACGGKEKNTNAVSPADTLSSQEQTVRRVNVDDALTVTADGNEVGEIFLLQYNWYGKEFVSEDSLNADRTFAFTLDYRKYGMYYYLLECEWENGNAAQYAFAVEKNKE